jgi:MFS transporter, DHA1 family, multidrug resistance protein
LEWRTVLPRLGLERDNKRIFWGVLFDEGALGIYMTILPLYIASLGASPAQIGLVLGVAGIVRIAMLTMSSVVTDRIPPRQLIALTRGLGIIGVAMLGLSTTWWFSMVGLIIMGAVIVSWPTVSNLIAENSRQGRQRMRAFTLIYTIAPSSALLITPALGGVVADWYGFQAVFVLSGVLKFAALGMFSDIREQPIPTSVGYTGRLVDVVQNHPVRMVCLFMFATIFILTMAMILLPNFLQDVHGISVSSIGWLGSISALGSIILGIALNRVSFLQKPQVILMLAVGAVGAALLILLFGNVLWLFGLAFFLRGGYFVAWSLFYAVLADVTPTWLRTRVYVVAEILGEGGYSLAPFLAGPLYGFTPQAPLVVGIIAIVPLMIALLWLSRYVTPSESDESEVERTGACPTPVSELD